MKKVFITAALATGILAVTGCGQQTPVQAQQQQQEINQETVQKIEQYIVFDQPNHAALKPEAYKNLTDKELAFAETSLANTNKMAAAGEVAYGAKPTDKLAIIDKNAAGVSKQWAYESGWFNTGPCWGWAETGLEWWGRWINADVCAGNKFKYNFERTAGVTGLGGAAAGGAIGSGIAGPLGGAFGAVAGVYPGWVWSDAAVRIGWYNWGSGVKIYIYPANLWIGVAHRW